ncbi:aquaporin-8-like isoform X3 [Physella acuta]|uniref:aquaporin-8-like isoform X2 n=1 Tax=Physella acuta TaxID=109671 RepID=UPI0027DC0FBC|nr:aquaporin-8-like isoform X2 [Physella acuta]XP_059141592.1 aquaporin-8-like isoform X3 [Physella acuta]
MSRNNKMSNEREPLINRSLSGDVTPAIELSKFEQYIRPCFAEFLGVTLFVFIGCTSVEGTGGNIVGIAIAHGFTIALLVTATGAISGGQLNPAVTIGVFLAGAISAIKAVLFILSQVAGGVLGAALSRGVLGNNVYHNITGGAHQLGPNTTVGEGLLCEVMLTTILVTVVLTTAVDDGTKSVVAPLAIGFTVVVDILAGGALTGASMNPARSFGPAVVVTSFDSSIWQNHWIYWVGPALGGLLAGISYRLILASPNHRFLKR